MDDNRHRYRGTKPKIHHHSDADQNDLNPEFISGKILINVDSEGEGVVTIGSAGGTVTRITLPTKTSQLPQEFNLFRVQVSGLRGGHSGLDIHEGRGNAIKIMAGVMEALNNASALLQRAKKVYDKVFGQAPHIRVAHGGLECSVIAAKIPVVDMIAIEPTIKNTHSANEALYIPSVGKLWQFLTALLASYGP
ncbi:MAG: M20/M25/M40 family metallo-hydrolase [Desulfobacterales bacterium]|jgi:di/tripeptidase